MSRSKAKPLSGSTVSLHLPEPLHSKGTFECMCVGFYVHRRICMYIFPLSALFSLVFFCIDFVFLLTIILYTDPFVTVTIDVDINKVF